VRILNVLHSLKQTDGGPIRAVLDLSAKTGDYGIESHVLGFGEVDIPDNPLHPGYLHALSVIRPGQYQFAPGLRTWLKKNLKSYDGVVLHGMWLYPNQAVAAACRGMGLPYACFPHGMLEPWSFYRQGSLKALKKLCYWIAFEKRVFANASHVLFTSKRELREANHVAQYIRRQSIVVPHGVSVAPTSCVEPTRPELRQAENRKIILFLGRIHPHKNLDMLLRCWAAARLSDEWHFIIAGYGRPQYLDHLLKLRKALRVESSTTFVGPVSGDDKIYLFKRAKWSLLASQHENFGIAALESIGHGCPVAVSDEVYVADSFHSDSVILPLDENSWIAFMRGTMLDEARRSKIIDRDASLIIPLFNIDRVTHDWSKTVREMFHPTHDRRRSADLQADEKQPELAVPRR
jgi:glycosyltransferase involved in cell wall biosynthesis